MSDLFEVITKDEYEEFTKTAPATAPSLVYSPPGTKDGAGADYKLEWCEFCKGYYILEFHYGDQGENYVTGR